MLEEAWFSPILVLWFSHRILVRFSLPSTRELMVFARRVAFGLSHGLPSGQPRSVVAMGYVLLGYVC